MQRQPYVQNTEHKTLIDKGFTIYVLMKLETFEKIFMYLIYCTLQMESVCGNAPMVSMVMKILRSVRNVTQTAGHAVGQRTVTVTAALMDLRLIMEHVCLNRMSALPRHTSLVRATLQRGKMYYLEIACL